MSRRAKTIIGVGLMVPVLAHLVYALWASPLTAYYITVGELHDRKTIDGVVRVGGQVVSGSIAWDGSRDQLGFALTDGIRQVPVVYSGLAPDAFRAGVTAIVGGRLDEDGRFLAQELLLKCPHKYVAG